MCCVCDCACVCACVCMCMCMLLRVRLEKHHFPSRQWPTVVMMHSMFLYCRDHPPPATAYSTFTARRRVVRGSRELLYVNVEHMQSAFRCMSRLRGKLYVPGWGNWSKTSSLTRHSIITFSGQRESLAAHVGSLHEFHATVWRACDATKPQSCDANWVVHKVYPPIFPSMYVHTATAFNLPPCFFPQCVFFAGFASSGLSLLHGLF